MKNFLAKHEIIPEILNGEQLSVLEQAIKDAKNENFTPFAFFIETAQSQIGNIAKVKQAVINQAITLSDEIISAVENALPTPNNANFSVFGEKISPDELKQCHENFIMAIFKIISLLGELSQKCVGVVSQADDRFLTEFKLRLAALSEFCPQTEITEKYRAFEPIIKKSDSKEISYEFLYLEKLISTLISETNDFCCKAENSLPEYILYKGTLLRYADVVNNISSKLKHPEEAQ